MNRSEQCHALAIELHSWIDNKDFKTWPEPSIQEIEELIREYMELDGPVKNNPLVKPAPSKHEELIGELNKGIQKYKWQAQMHGDKTLTNDKALSQYFNGMKTAENLFVAHLKNLVRDYGLDLMACK